MLVWGKQDMNSILDALIDVITIHNKLRFKKKEAQVIISWAQLLLWPDLGSDITQKPMSLNRRGHSKFAVFFNDSSGTFLKYLRRKLTPAQYKVIFWDSFLNCKSGLWFL